MVVSKRVMWVAAALVVGVTCAYNMDLLVLRHNESVQDLIDEVERGVPKWESGTFAVVAQAVQSNYAAAAVALGSNDFTTAYRLAYYEGKNTLETWANAYGANEASPGVTVRAFAEQLHEAYRAEVGPAFERAVQLTKTGDLPLDDLRNLVAWHGDFPELKKSYDAQQQEIANARVRAAGRWVRITASSDVGYEIFRDMVRETVRTKFAKAPGLKIVYGYSTGHQEDQATFKALEVRVQSEFAHYTVGSRKGYGADWVPPQIPEVCTMTFTMRQARAVASTWDRLPQIQVKKTAPSALSAEAAEATRDKYTAALLEGLRQGLAGIREFELYPGVDPASLRIVKDGQLDPSAFLALGWKDPAELDAQVKPLLATRDLGLRAALAFALAERGDARYGTWVAQAATSLGPHEQKLLATALAVNPSFGGYDPLLAVIRASKDYPFEAVSALRGHLTQPKVKKLIVDKIDNPATPMRVNYMTAFIAEVPKQELASYAAWLRDRDEQFANAAYIAILNEDRDLADALVLREFDGMPARVKETMIAQFRFDPAKNPAAGLAVLRKAATQRESAPLKQAALYKIMEVPSTTPAGWDLLNDLAAHEGDPRMRDQMQQKLLFNIERAYPDRAEAYYLRAMKEDHGSLRDAAINSLLEMDGPRDARVSHVAALLKNPIGGSDLARVVLMSVNQYVAIRKGWNFSQPELLDIVARGAADRDPQVRGFAYSIMAEGAKQGAPGYEADLRKLILKEPDPRVQENAQRKLDQVGR